MAGIDRGSHRLKLAAACIACAITWMLCTGVGLADAPDPIGLPTPSSAPPLVGSSPGPYPWISLAHQPSFRPGSMLLMSDGTVLVHKDDSVRWEELVPSRRGSYVAGRWHPIASLPAGYAPQYFASAVLPDGRLIILGGEYDGSAKQIETDRGAVYSPETNSWTSLAGPPGWTEVGDAQSTLLDNGSFLLANLSGSDDALLDPNTLTWTPTGTGKFDPNSEEGFSLLPDGRVLTVDTDARGSELYSPASGTWSSAGTIPTELVGGEDEQGPLVGAPNGTVFAVGATGHTAIYHSAANRPGRWTSGPNLPAIDGRQLVAADSAGARLPDGDALIDASPPGYKAPTHFFIFNGRHLSLLDDNGTARRTSAYDTRMLVLPTGQILYDDDQQIYAFRSTGTPQAAWRPRIDSVPRRLARGDTYVLSGTQLAGRDQGAAYGDDFQDDTNYPLVRILSGASKTVTYARTVDWSSVSTALGAPASTNFTLPRDTPLGTSTLVVVANGIASAPAAVTITR